VFVREKEMPKLGDGQSKPAKNKPEKKKTSKKNRRKQKKKRSRTRQGGKNSPKKCARKMGPNSGDFVKQTRFWGPPRVHPGKRINSPPEPKQEDRKKKDGEAPPQ